MLTKVIRQLNRLQWPQHFSFKKAKVISPKTACLKIDSKELSIIGMNEMASQKELIFNKIEKCEDVIQLNKILDHWISLYRLAEIPLTWMLQSKDYRLLIIDDLLVEPYELQSAIQLKIKSLIDFPIEDALIDSFPIPLKKADISQKKIMVAVSRISYIQSMLDQLQKSTLQVSTITIPELGLKNISALYENDENSNLLIYLTEGESHLLITAQKTLYLSRKLEINQALFEPNFENTDTGIHEFNQFILEIQRSLDYYQSEWRKSTISQIVFASTWPNSQKIMEKLSAQLNIPVKSIIFDDFFIINENLSLTEQALYLPMIGGILKEE